MSAPGALLLLLMNTADVRRWIAGFEAAAAADRDTLRGRAPDPAWSIRVSLELIDAARRAGHRFDASDAAREADAEAVRATWARLRARLGR